MKTITLDELLKKYPKIFQDYEGNPYRVNWSGVPKGWLPIIDKLCSSMQSYIDGTRRWDKEKKEWIHPPQVTCAQMKEKFGGLRFYTDGHNDVIEGMITMAEYLCSNTCEVCSSEEELGYTTGWITVCCKSCHTAGIKKPLNHSTHSAPLTTLKGNMWC